MKIATVIPLKKGVWKENLTYFTAQDVENGNVVVVPLRNKKVLGLVISTESASVNKESIKKMSFNLKKIIEVKEHSIFLSEYIASAIETSKYFAQNKNNGITSLIPASLRENYDKISKIENTNLPTSRKELVGVKPEKLLFQAPWEERISTYKTLIRGSFAQKKSVFIVLPTENDIKVFEEQLSRGIEQFTFSLHGGLSAKKVLTKFEQIINNNHPVLILGTAPFLIVKP